MKPREKTMEIIQFEEAPKHIREKIEKKIRGKVIDKRIAMGFRKKYGVLPLPPEESITNRDVKYEIEKIIIFKTGNPPFYFYSESNKLGF